MLKITSLSITCLKIQKTSTFIFSRIIIYNFNHVRINRKEKTKYITCTSEDYYKQTKESWWHYNQLFWFKRGWSSCMNKGRSGRFLRNIIQEILLQCLDPKIRLFDLLEVDRLGN